MEHILLISKSIIFFSLLIFVVVGFHEYGHFITAKKLGIKVLKFSIGMGKEAYGWTGKDGVRYSISWLPIGGYVQMLDSTEMDEADLKQYSKEDLSRSFDKAPRWKRFLVVAFGPIFNLIMAIIGFTVISYGTLTMPSTIVDYVSNDIKYEQNGALVIEKGDVITSVNGTKVETWTELDHAFIGSIGSNRVKVEVKGKGEIYIDLEDKVLDSKVKDLSYFIGILPQYKNHTNVVGAVLEDSPAEKAGLKQEDQVISIDGVSVENFYELSKIVNVRPAKSVELVVKREGQLHTLDVELGEKGNPIDGKTGFLGVAPMMQKIDESHLIVKEVGVKDAIITGLERTYDGATLIVNTLYKLVTGHVSPTSLSGAIGIADTAQKAASFGLMSFIGFVSMFSINLMVLNLLPIKPLDGGHLFSYTVEAITGKQVPEMVDKAFTITGLVLVSTLMIVGLGADIMRIIF